MRIAAKASHIKQACAAEMTLERMLLIKTLLTGPYLNDYIFFLILRLYKDKPIMILIGQHNLNLFLPYCKGTF